MIQYFIDQFTGLIGFLIQRYGFIVSLLGLSIFIDLVTGIIKSKIRGTISSNIGYIGFWKKAALLVALCFGFFLDLVESYLLLNTTGTNTLKFSFGLLIGSYIILNECISICENLYACGIKLPKCIIRSLKKASSNLDSKGNDKNNYLKR